MRKCVADILAALLVLIVSVVFYSQTGELEELAMYFPRMLLAFLGGGGLILLAKGVRGFMADRAPSDAEPASMKRIVLITVCSVAYVAAIPFLGFYPATGVFLFGTAMLLRDAAGLKTALMAASALTIIITLTVWAGFALLLGVPTPESVLF